VRPNRRHREARIASLLLILGLSGLTAWNLTRSGALEEAARAYSRADFVSAMRHALDHLERRPWSRDAALLAARCLSRLDYAPEAEAYYRRAGRLTLNDMQIRAYGLARGPNPQDAIPAYREILAISPQNTTAMRRLAAVLLARGDSAELLTLAELLSRAPEGRVIGLMLRGVVYHNDHNPQQAAAAFERILQLDPDLDEMPGARPLFWRHYTEDLAGSGRLADAGKYLSQLLANTADAELMNRLGVTYFLEGALDEAERCFRQAAEWDPSLYLPHLELAKLAVHRHWHAEALAHLTQARLLAPRRYDVLYNLASLYRQLGQADEADRAQEAIRSLRHEASAATTTAGRWPRYAL
jgi:tetratricopeptide (TPR) repeat protein